MKRGPIILKEKKKKRKEKKKKKKEKESGEKERGCNGKKGERVGWERGDKKEG